MLILILSNTLVVLSSYFIARRLFTRISFTDFLLVCFTLFLAQVVLIGLFLGIMGKLFTLNIILLESIILLASFSAYSINKPRSAFSKPDFRFIFENKIILLALAVFIAFFSSKLWLNLINPPACPDSLQYHLTFPANWLQSGNLNNPLVIFGFPPTSAELSALSYYPIDSELFFFWLMFPLKNAFLADAGQVPFYFIGILAIYSILRKFNLRKDTAFFCGLLWVLIPNIFKQLRTASQVDVICAALFLLALNYLIILGREFKLKNACFFGLALGLLCGTKLLNLYWITALVPLLAYYIYLNYPKYGLGRIFGSFSVIAAGIFLLGSFSYIRTFLTTGNPFYPVKISILGKAIFPGFIDKDTFSNLFVRWSDFSLIDMFFSEGLGVQFIVFILLATFIPLLALFFLRKRHNFNAESITLFFIPPIMFFLYFWVIRAYWVRYVFPYLGIGMIAAFLFLDKFKWGKKYITILGFACIFSSAAELAHRNELIISLSASALIFALLIIFRKRILSGYSHLFNWKAAALVTAIIFAGLYFLNEKYDREKFRRYTVSTKGKGIVQKDLGLAWEWLNENTGSGRRVAYTGRSEIYPLFGTKLKNRVFYISTNDKPSMPHYFSDGLYRKEKNFEAWRENLKKEEIDYFFAALPFDVNNESGDKKEFPAEDRWAA
ncbi:MAG: hypothetical protein WC417_06430, partial [Candidatus Omnitrophota bacterium]